MNKKTIKRSTALALLLFFALLLLCGGALFQRQQAKLRRTEAILSASYSRSFFALTDYVSAISAALEKELLATPAQMALLSADIWRLAGAAQENLTALPLSQGDGQKLAAYLSQVGDFVRTLSRKVINGGAIAPEEEATLQALADYCQTVSQTLTAMRHDVAQGKSDMLQADVLPAISQGFTVLEEEFAGYPTLLYDGPFSDHLSQRQAAFLYGMDPLTQAEAQTKAAALLGVSEASLRFSQKSAGTVPCYTFAFSEGFLSLTEAGGYPALLAKARAVTPQKEIPQAIAAAQAFLEGCGFPAMEQHYYHLAEGILTINFAHNQQGITVYPDLIKVGVAMDNLEIMSLDAAPYLMNHVASRAVGTIAHSAEEAIRRLPASLSFVSSRLVIIPSPGQFELLCHELQCKSREGKTYLLYCNAYTGAEEKILVLVEDENGVLTR